MCSTSITISEESFKSDFSDLPAQAVNDVVTTEVFSRAKIRHQYASCRSGRLKSLSLDKLPLQNVSPTFTPLDSLVTKSLLDMTRAQAAETDNIQESSNNVFKREEDESADQAELSATILDNGDGMCNSFDTTIACDDIIAIEDVSDEDDADSGVHNTPDILNNNNNSSDDTGDHSLDVLTHDSLYESLKYQQGSGRLEAVSCLCPVLHRSLLTSVGVLSKLPAHDPACPQCHAYLQTVQRLVQDITHHNQLNNKKQPVLTRTDVEKEIVARARSRERRRDNIVLNDRVIGCYIGLVILIILVLVIVIIALSVLDINKYNVF